MDKVPDFYPVLPGYLRGVSGSLTPGLAFGMYAAWKKQAQRRKGKIEWRNALDKGHILAATVKAGGEREPKNTAETLAQRSEAILARGPGALFQLTLTSPLATGLGNEHPVENGFTFSVPHGLPMLPGSAIKGTVRAAAERLALAGEGGWDLRHVWLDFGFDANAGYMRTPSPKMALQEEREAWRGAYRAHVDGAHVQGWDDLERIWPTKAARARWKAGDESVRRAMLLALQEPQVQQRTTHAQAASLDPSDLDPAQVHFRGTLLFHDGWFTAGPKGLLKREIMTPHFGGYHQKEGAVPPTDDMGPNPIPFLAVVPGCTLHLGVSASAPPGGDWRARLMAAVEHAAKDLGFGAKGGAGYGRAKVAKVIDPYEQRRKALEEERRKAEEAEAARKQEEEGAAKDPVDRLLSDLKKDQGSETIANLFSAAEQGGELSGDRKVEVAKAFKEAMERLGLWTTKKKKKKWKARTERIEAILSEGGDG